MAIERGGRGEGPATIFFLTGKKVPMVIKIGEGKGKALMALP